MRKGTEFTRANLDGLSGILHTERFLFVHTTDFGPLLKLGQNVPPLSQGDGLTFVAKSEIIYFHRADRILARRLILFLALPAHFHLS